MTAARTPTETEQIRAASFYLSKFDQLRLTDPDAALEWLDKFDDALSSVRDLVHEQATR